MNNLCREQKDSGLAKNGGKSNAASNEQSAGLSSQCTKPSSSSKSSDSVKKPCLHSRTRSLENMRTSDMKHEPAKRSHSNMKESDVKAAGRLRSQSVERELTRKSSASKRPPQMKLTIPHTPQLLK